jgi:hypothetical protein
MVAHAALAPADAAYPGSGPRERVIARGLEMSCISGIQSLTVEGVASSLGTGEERVRSCCARDEDLQLTVLNAAAQLFAERVFYPAFKKPRGLRRLEAFLENWLRWNRAPGVPGGCVFIVSSIHWSEGEGPVRAALVAWFEQMYAALRKATSQAIEVGELRPDTDLEQFASDLHAIAMKYHHDVRLIHRPDAAQRARVSFFRLVKSARVAPATAS